MTHKSQETPEDLSKMMANINSHHGKGMKSTQNSFKQITRKFKIQLSAFIINYMKARIEYQIEKTGLVNMKRKMYQEEKGTMKMNPTPAKNAKNNSI